MDTYAILLVGIAIVVLILLVVAGAIYVAWKTFEQDYLCPCNAPMEDAELPKQEPDRYYDEWWQDGEETKENLSLKRRACFRIWSLLYPEESFPCQETLEEDVDDRFAGLLLSLKLENSGQGMTKVWKGVTQKSPEYREVDSFIMKCLEFN